VIDPFATPRRKIAHAKKKIADFEGESRRFFAQHPFSFLIEPDPNEPKHEVHKLRFNQSLPDSLSNLTADAVNGLRSSLDNLGYALAVVAGKTNPRHAAFPFAGSAGEFENALSGKSKDIPKVIYPLFRAYKPYKGGNNFLWALNEIAITDKHKLLSIQLGSMLGNMEAEGGFVSMPVNPIWDSLKKEIVVSTWAIGSNVKYKADFALSVIFDEIEIVDGEPVLRVLDYFANIVEDILLGIQAESRRLGIIN